MVDFLGLTVISRAARKKWEPGAGTWRLRTGNWSLELEMGPRKWIWELGAGIWEMEPGSWKLGARTWELETGNWKLETGSWELGAGYPWARTQAAVPPGLWAQPLCYQAIVAQPSSYQAFGHSSRATKPEGDHGRWTACRDGATQLPP